MTANARANPSPLAMKQLQQLVDDLGPAGDDLRAELFTIHEAILKNQQLDIDGGLELLAQARKIIHAEDNLPDDAVGPRHDTPK